MLKRNLLLFIIGIYATSCFSQQIHLQVLGKEQFHDSALICVKASALDFYHCNLSGEFIFDKKRGFEPQAISVTVDGAQQKFEIVNYGIQSNENKHVYKLMLIPYAMESAIVAATRVGSKEPFAVTDISKEEIEAQNTGRDLPVLLQFAPGVITTSDAGNGVGYTGIRVRGSDASRTNVTINGVPVNDAESQSTFWVNMPDLASSVQNIQIQRGAGSSTNGSGSFGANVNIQTGNALNAYGILSQSYGSFNTHKTNVAAGSGMLNNHFALDLRLSKIHSNGFIDRAASDLTSYFISTAFIEKNWFLKVLHFSGTEQTYQAWNGIPREKLYGPDTALKQHYFRNIPGTYRNQNDSMNLFGSNKRSYNYYIYDNETDNYTQSQTHVYFNYNFNVKNSFNTTVYRTVGKGYFEQFRFNDALNKYGLPNAIFGSDTITNSDLIRRRWLQNTLTGVNINWIHKGTKWNVTSGAGYSQYLGNHFGEIVWARTAPSAGYLGRYYNGIGDKYDGNIFLKTGYAVNGKLGFFGDFQLRRVYHVGSGFDNDLRPVRFTGNFLFYNQKLGFNWMLKQYGSIYASASFINKEPSRSDFADRKNNTVPSPESMWDYELGWRKTGEKFMTTANIYVMNFKNQLVLTGEINDVGTPLRMNVPKSYRAGIELASSYRLAKKWQLAGNLALSKNAIKKVVIQTTDYADNSIVKDTLYNTPIGYSPAAVAAFIVTWIPNKKWSVSWNHKYVSKQYLDNSGSPDKSIDGYYFSEIWINKTWAFKRTELEFKIQLLNVLNNLYNNNGYAFEYFYGKGNLTREVFLFPSAPRNILANFTIKF